MGVIIQMDIFLLIFIIIFVFILYYNKSISDNKIEKLKDITVTTKKNSAPENNIDLLQDPTFKNVVFYINDEDPYAPEQKLGLQKCFDKCVGTCVEYGITGNAFCFPK
jgi:hypothetical protein